jgi:hypothetical protein
MTTKTNDLAARLWEVWSAEYDDIELRYETPFSVNPPQWVVGLVGRSDSFANPHGADWIEHTWQFYGHELADALAEALTFAEALAALDPDAVEINPATGHSVDCGCTSCYLSQHR